MVFIIFATMDVVKSKLEVSYKKCVNNGFNYIFKLDIRQNRNNFLIIEKISFANLTSGKLYESLKVVTEKVCWDCSVLTVSRGGVM